MKYLVVVLVVVIAVWLMLRGRKLQPAQPRRQRDVTDAMVQCCHCGVHLPRAEAIEDQSGVFCSEAHHLAGRR